MEVSTLECGHCVSGLLIGERVSSGQHRTRPEKALNAAMELSGVNLI